jgi:hypothetical protein
MPREPRSSKKLWIQKEPMFWYVGVGSLNTKSLTQLVDEWEKPLRSLSATKNPALTESEVNSIFSIAEGSTK